VAFFGTGHASLKIQTCNPKT